MVIAAKDFEKESIIFSHKWMPNILCSWGYYLNLRTFCCKCLYKPDSKDM